MSPHFKSLLTGFVETAVGLVIFCVFLGAGMLLKQSLQLILPANVLGMLLLLIAISLGLVKTRWIERAGSYLLFLLPLLFVPIYVGAGAYRAIWIQWGWLLVPVLIVTVIAMWIFSGRLSQTIHRLLRKTPGEGARP